MKTTQKSLNALTYNVVGAAIEVHRHLGPGLLESAYEKTLQCELEIRGLRWECQRRVDLHYKNLVLPYELRFDILVENQLLVEVKSVPAILPVFEAQLLTYMRLCEVPKGILMNFMVTNLYKEGIRTFVSHHFSMLQKE